MDVLKINDDGDDDDDLLTSRFFQVIRNWTAWTSRATTTNTSCRRGSSSRRPTFSSGTSFKASQTSIRIPKNGPKCSWTTKERWAMLIKRYMLVLDTLPLGCGNCAYAVVQREIQLPLKRFQHLFPNLRLLTLAKTSSHQKLIPTSPLITALWWLKAGCLPYAVGKQPSIPSINLRRKWMINWLLLLSLNVCSTCHVLVECRTMLCRQWIVGEENRNNNDKMMMMTFSLDHHHHLLFYFSTINHGLDGCFPAV